MGERLNRFMTPRDALLASVIRHVDVLSRSMVLGVIIDHFAVGVGVGVVSVSFCARELRHQRKRP